MNLGLFEIALLAGSAATAIAGGVAAAARRRTATLLVLNAGLAACFGYFAVTGLRSGSIMGLGLGLVALLHLSVTAAIVRRASDPEPVA